MVCVQSVCCYSCLSLLLLVTLFSFSFSYTTAALIVRSTHVSVVAGATTAKAPLIPMQQAAAESCPQTFKLFFPPPAALLNRMARKMRGEESRGEAEPIKAFTAPTVFKCRVTYRTSTAAGRRHGDTLSAFNGEYVYEKCFWGGKKSG